MVNSCSSRCLAVNEANLVWSPIIDLFTRLFTSFRTTHTLTTHHLHNFLFHRSSVPSSSYYAAVSIKESREIYKLYKNFISQIKYNLLRDLYAQEIFLNDRLSDTRVGIAIKMIRKFSDKISSLCCVRVPKCSIFST